MSKNKPKQNTPKPDARDQFQDYCDMWNDACESGLFDDAEDESPQKSILGFGTSPRQPLEEDEDVESDFEHDDPYHNYLPTVLDEEDESLLQEEETPNPVYPASTGADSAQPKPVWVGMNPAFQKLVELKQKLYDIECKLAEVHGGGKKWVEKCHHPDDKKLLAQLESLRRQADTLSNQLGLEDEPKDSMYKTRR